jgi:hypothetical protein
MPQTISYTDIDAILQKVIRPGVADQLSKKVKAYRMFKGDSADAPKIMTNVDFVNKTYNIPIRTGRNNGVLGMIAGGKLNHGKPVLKQATVTAALIAASMEMDKFTLSVKSAGSAAGGVFTQYGQMLSDDMIKGMNRMLNRKYATSGQIGTTSALGSSVAQFTFAATTNGVYNSAKYLAVGDYVQVGAAAFQQVASVNTSTRVVTLTNPSTGAASSISFSAGDAVLLTDPLGNVSTELTSFFDMIGTGAFQGVTDTAWASQIDSTAYTSGGTPLSDSIITNMILQCNEYGSVNVGLANRFVYNLIAKILTQLKKTADTHESPIVGGFRGLAYAAGDGDVTIALDYDMADDRLNLIDTTSIMRGELQPVEWEDNGNGSKMIRRPDYLERQAVLTTLWNAGVINRAANGAITSIQG